MYQFVVHITFLYRHVFCTIRLLCVHCLVISCIWYVLRCVTYKLHTYCCCTYSTACAMCANIHGWTQMGRVVEKWPKKNFLTFSNKFSTKIFVYQFCPNYPPVYMYTYTFIYFVALYTHSYSIQYWRLY